MDQDNSRQHAIHPGAYVRQHVIPEGMTVTKAAKLLRIGRPALSNFLNGNADLSPEMALRLERTFRADSERLIELQAKFDHVKEAEEQESVVVGVYAPELAEIKAMDIHDWAQNISARQELAALLRRLIHSTGRDLTRVDFPAYDNAERKGWDGIIETSTPTPWIPIGKSGWELSCRGDIRTKAENDYKKSLKSVRSAERHDTTFVFVTARNWQGKKDWAKKKNAIGHWKDVRAYDASDLEQWLEQSAPAQVWFAERLGKPTAGFRSIEKCWREWTEVCEPTLTPALFNVSVERFSKDLKSWLNGEPGRPFIIAADSREEALAFLRCFAQSGKSGIPGLGHRMIVFDTPEALEPMDSECRLSIVAVTSTREAEAKIGGLYRRCHCVIIRPPNNVYDDPDIVLDRLHFLDFHKALESMGYAYDEIERLARESGCSLTILRRRLSNIPEVKTPSWAGDGKIALKLLPAAMVGAWHIASPGDRDVVGRLARTDDYAIVEQNVAELLTLKDVPLWSAGEYQGVVSRIDALLGIAAFITETDLDNFLEVAKDVLSDTAIDMAPDRRFLANSPESAPRHSNVLLRGIRETLILLAVYGNRLFHGRLGFDAEARMADFVDKLLSPFNREALLSYGNDLPDYAEAAPNVVLSLLEKDLRSSEPVVRELMHPAGPSIFSPPRRTPVLWALQMLAWDPQRFPRVVEFLAKLCEMYGNEVDDNWSPKPQETLASLFRSWWPQTAAPLKMRVNALKCLCRQHPNFGWSVCIGQLELLVSGSANRRSRWRDDKASAAPQVTEAERLRFVRESVDLVLDWQEYDERTLGELVEHLEQFNEADQLKVWDLIDRWADSTPTKDARAILRQRINGSAQMRRRRGSAIVHPERELATSHALSPPDKETRQRRLFATYWVDLHPDNSDDGGFEQEREEKCLRDLRLETLREIWRERGIQGVHDLVEKSKKASALIGELMAETLAGQDQDAAKFFRSCLDLATAHNSTTHRSCLTGFVRNIDADLFSALINETERSRQLEEFTTVLLCMPFRTKTWRLLDNKPSEFQNSYWTTVKPRTWSASSPEEINESVDRLLAVGRSQAAFRAACVAWERVETSLLKRLLYTLPTAASDGFLDDPMTDEYHISSAFDELDNRQGVTVEEKARLEYAHLEWLDRSKHGIPNIEKHIIASPELYALSIACVYRRVDGREDPPEFNVGDPKQQLAIARQAQKLLRRIRRIPGTDVNGNIHADELKAWLGEVRSLCNQFGRTKIGDQEIGRLLAQAPEAEGIWPCRPVCEALQSMESGEVGESFVLGTLNRRGVYMKGKGGDKERDHMNRYRSWASDLAIEYPFVSGLLERIATFYQDEAGRQDTETEVMRRFAL